MKSYHLSQSVDGALANWRARDWAGIVYDHKGRVLPPAGVKLMFESLRDRGVKLIPLGDCSNFDQERGCLGHEVTL